MKYLLNYYWLTIRFAFNINNYDTCLYKMWYLLFLLPLSLFSCQTTTSSENKNLIQSLIDSASHEFEAGNFKNTIFILTQTEALTSNSNRSTRNLFLPKIFNIRAGAYRITGQYIKSFEDYQASLKIAMNHPQTKEDIFKSYFGLAILFYYYQPFFQESNTIASYYLSKADENSGSAKDEALITYFKLESYIISNKIDSAVIYLNLLESYLKNDTQYLHKTMEPWIWEARAKIDAADSNSVDFSQKIVDNFNKSIYLNEGKDNLKLKSPYQIAFVKYYKAHYLFRFLPHRDSAFVELMDAYNISSNINAPYIKVLVASDLKDYYLQKGEYANAKMYENELKSINSNLSSSNLGIIERENARTADRKRLLEIVGAIIFVAIFIIILIVAIIFNKKNKKLKKTKIGLESNFNTKQQELEAIHKDLLRRDEWNVMFHELLLLKEALLKEASESIEMDLNKIAELLAIHFKSDYCAIGLEIGNKLISFNYYFNINSSCFKYSAENTLSNISPRDLLKQELINENLKYKIYQRDSFNHDNNTYLKAIKDEILIENTFNNLIVVCLHSIGIEGKDEVPLGYISIINASNIDSNDQEQLELYGKQLSNLFNILIYRKRDIYKKRDDLFINELNLYGSDFDKIFDHISKYFITEFNVSIISFRVPVLNGTNNASLKDNLIFPLRYYKISDNINIDPQIISSHYTEKRKLIDLKNLNYCDVSPEMFGSGVYFDDSEIEKISYQPDFNIHDVCHTNSKVVLFIHKTIKSDHIMQEYDAFWKSLYGIFNLRPKYIGDREELENRLNYLGNRITILVNNIINKKKHSQINILKQEIYNLRYSQASIYEQVAKMISRIINAEICSVFMFDRSTSKLQLKASTAQDAHYNGVRINLKEANNYDIFYSDEDKNSITMQVQKDGLTRLIHSINNVEHSLKFLEIPERGDHNDYSILFVPLKNKDGNSIGVIKCMGITADRTDLINSFWDFDKETIELVAALATRLIEISLADKEKDDFIKQVVHEMLTPLAAILGDFEETQSRMKRNAHLDKVFIEDFERSMRRILVYKQVLVDLDLASAEMSDEKWKLNPTLENIHEIIKEEVQLFEKMAHFEKSVSIKTNISKVPEVFIDQSKMVQVFNNLLKNAVNYSNNRSEINIFYKYITEPHLSFNDQICNNWHEIKFVNFGIGIPSKEVEDIFLLYRRGSNAKGESKNGKVHGSGIGLYLVRKIMKLHGGHCMIRKLTNPTEISVLLPAELNLLSK